MPPIHPDKVSSSIPEEIFECFNELIQKNYTNGSSTIKQPDILDLIVSKTNLTRDEIFKRNYLNIEFSYREVGWIVEYTKSEVGDNFDSYFVFKKKDKNEH